MRCIRAQRVCGGTNRVVVGGVNRAKHRECIGFAVVAAEHLQGRMHLAGVALGGLLPANFQCEFATQCQRLCASSRSSQLCGSGQLISDHEIRQLLSGRNEASSDVLIELGVELSE